MDIACIKSIIILTLYVFLYSIYVHLIAADNDTHCWFSPIFLQSAEHEI